MVTSGSTRQKRACQQERSDAHKSVLRRTSDLVGERKLRNSVIGQNPLKVLLASYQFSVEQLFERLIAFAHADTNVEVERQIRIRRIVRDRRNVQRHGRVTA